MSVYFRSNNPSMSSMKKRGRRQQTKIVHVLMESVRTSRQVYSCRWHPTTSFSSAIMQPMRLMKFVYCPTFGLFWDHTQLFTCFGAASDLPAKRVRFVVQQPQWNQSQQQHQQPTKPLLPPHQRSAAINKLGNASYWPSSIPWLVAHVVVVSDFLVLLALVFHFFESSTSSLPSSLVSSSLSSIEPLVSTVSLCNKVVCSLSLASDGRESCSREPQLSSAWTSDRTLFFIWIFDSMLLGCAVLCRLIRTSSIWLWRSKYVCHSFSFKTDSKLNPLFKRETDGDGKFNDFSDRASSKDGVRINTIRRFNSDRNHARWIRNCDVALSDWWHCLWPFNSIHGARLPDIFPQSRPLYRPRCDLWWTSVFSQWQSRPNNTNLDRNVGNDQFVKRQSHFRLPTSLLPVLEAKKPTRLIFEKKLRITFDRKAAGLSSTPIISSSFLVIVLLLICLSSVAVSSSTNNLLSQAVPPPSTSTRFSPSLPSAQSSSSSSLANDRFPMTDSLNPGLATGGGLILRAATGNTPNSSPLNWIRPNPGSCIPQPIIPACPSDRFCRLPETTGSFDSNGRSFPVPFAQPSGSMPLNSNGSSKNGVNSYYWPLNSATSNDGGRESKERREKVRRSEDGGITDDDGSRNADAIVAKASQCLPYLQPGRRQQSETDDDVPSSAECICGNADGARRVDTLRKYHLHHCYHYSLWHVLSDTMREGIAMSRSQCYAYLEDVERLDNLAAHFVCQFEDIIRRYDCGQTFSSKSSCQQCKVAYRQWVCSMVLPMWLDGDRIKPCRTFCHEVERLCPYFLPAEKSGPGSQYAGEPSFLCIDPDVRETTNQSTNSDYSERSCYRPCTLDYNLEPDIDPSVCVASLGDMSGLVEEDGPAESIPDKECKHTYKNVTASVSEFVSENASIDSDVNDDQCTPFLGKDPQLSSTVSSKGWINNLHFVWPWRTLVLPFAILTTILNYFT